ncbi:hypothetical protein ASPWEDRAFT_155286 [Aspergillus wentii DTO 134E9]|uniref:Glycosyl hydrolase n=1 Tax=Aspergillus wentii DTO 134E9 TaxID=1073089 RepID=A0A1L9RKP0_ASPWE|nr:uncharacterized protein ASPWEDRAFT_155286 [Aspergillus wentii DTO 134E9]KAI9924769.1 hypothetical protein MW887_006625 [Aspergillus wentii]OJJ35463.1 hypothetical protein ASPWEDRAFT_155286 [Aspergillus wentii DTO 134E9]
MVLSIFISLSLYVLSISSGANALAHPPQNVLAPSPHDSPAQTVLDEIDPSHANVPSNSSTLKSLLHALNVMQDGYFELWRGTWPTSIDWTAAVVGTQVSATLSSLTSSGNDTAFAKLSGDEERELKETTMARGEVVLENIVSRFFDQTSAFYFGENAISLRTQANDDMLWVVLGWLESIKFQVLHSDLRYESNLTSDKAWHGTQLRVPAAHRARIFYELASFGWDTFLCDGGMIWSPYLTPYKNAITNELWISASIGMYLYHPGDSIDFPFMVNVDVSSDEYPHNPTHLEAAKKGYDWLKNSKMIGPGGLYADGFHINGWQNIKKPGTRKCDELNTMVYTYNQGVILSGLRGLWLATASYDYLRDGHELVEKVIRATGWADQSSREWSGLGRGGVLEEACDSAGTCTQDGHTFKGIFFNHLAEFCRAIRPQEERFLAYANLTSESEWKIVYDLHQSRCRGYRPWIQHNAEAALVTLDNDGKFGAWWGQQYPASTLVTESSPLPAGAVDYRNCGGRVKGAEELFGALRRRPESVDRRGRQPTEAQSGTEGARTSGVNQMDVNDRGGGRTVETQSGGVAVLRALYQWETTPALW